MQVRRLTGSMLSPLSGGLFSALGMGTALLAVGSLVWMPGASAQTQRDPQGQSLSDFIRPQDSGADAFGRGGALNPMELIHRANLSNSKTQEAFLQEQRQNINSEAEDFRARQVELIRAREAQQSGATSGN